MNFAQPSRIEESAPIELPALAEVLEVARAVSAADDVTLEQLVSRSARPEEVYTLIRQTAPYTSYCLGPHEAYEYSALWVMPILTSRGSRRASCRGPLASNVGAAMMTNWIGEWFGFLNQARHFNFIPDYQVLSNMTAGDVRGALEALVSRGVAAKPQFRKSVVEQPAECPVPELAFLMGSVSRLNDDPSFPLGTGTRALEFQQKLAGAIEFHATDRGAQRNAYWVGVPEDFSGGLLTGLTRWAAAVQADFCTEELDIHPLGFDDVRLEWTVRCEESEQRFQISKHLRYSQLGRQGVEQVIAEISSPQSSQMKTSAQLYS
jgi:hypothetical protein